MTAPGSERSCRPRVFALGCISLSVLAIILVLLSIAAVYAPLGTDAAAQGRPLVISSLQDTEKPVADAGGDFTAYVGAVTIFNASRSTDNVGVTNYIWNFTDSVPILLPGETAEYIFTAVGTYVVTLKVTDAEGNWDTDVITVTVTVDSTPPVANAGRNTTVYSGYTFTLSGRRSSDPETGISNYTWTVEHEGSSATYFGRDVRYKFGDTGTYLITLNVTNGIGLKNETSISIECISRPSWVSQNMEVLAVLGAVVIGIALYVVYKVHRDKALLTPLEREKLRLRIRDTRKMLRIFRANKLGFAGLIILTVFMVMAGFAHLLVTVEDPMSPDFYEQPPSENPRPPSLDMSGTGLRHPFGTDSYGRDVFSMTIYGARASLLVGFAATLISMVVGASIGLASGFFGKWSDEILMRFTDYFLVLPWFPLMIVLMTVLGHDFIWVVVVIGITSWPSTARVVRSQVLTVKERTFIERARCVGARDGYIIRKHIFPNVLPLIFANTILLISNAIFSEAFLDFFGLGDPSVISWGTMLEDAYNGGAFDSGAWWWTLPPSLAIILCVLAFSLVGYALDDIFNPRLRRR